MAADFSKVAAELLGLHPQSLYHWHHLATAGFHDNDPLIVHHGITGSLIFGMDHPVTMDILIRALKTWTTDSPWHSLFLETIASLGRPLLPVLIDGGHLLTHANGRRTSDLQALPATVERIISLGNLEHATAVLLAYESALNNPGPDSTVMKDIIGRLIKSPQLEDGSIHTVPLHVHMDLARLARKYSFALECKLKVQIPNVDSLSIFNQHLKPVLHSIDNTSERIQLLTDQVRMLAMNEKCNYIGAHLIGVCACCLDYDSPQERIEALRLVCGDNISIYASSDLVTRFFLRAAPPSLATQFLRQTINGPRAVLHPGDDGKDIATLPDALAACENSYYFQTLSELDGPVAECDLTEVIPSFRDINTIDLNKSRTNYINADRFAVAMFGQTRQSAFPTISGNLRFCVEQMGQRFDTCSLSSWSETAASRYPKNVVELSCLFRHSEAAALARSVANDESVDSIYSLLASYHNLSLTNQRLHEALPALCNNLENIEIRALDEKQSERDFDAIYNVSSAIDISDAQKKVLRNQYKMWCTINAAIQLYLDSSCNYPLILHRSDVSLARIIDFIDESKIFARQNIAIAADIDMEAFVVPPVGGMGDRFWIMTRHVAEVIHTCLSSIKSSPLVNLTERCNTSFNLPRSARVILFEHHRYCDMMAHLFSPSFYAMPVRHASIQATPLFDIECNDFRRLLTENGFN